MIEFDIEKHMPKIVDNVSGIKKYLCRIRKMLIHITPEETVRQTFINYLVDEKEFPENRIKLEESVFYHQTKDQKKHKGRTDILVFDDGNTPFILYECKMSGESFTDNIYEQLFSYLAEIYSIDYIGVVIGKSIQLLDIRFI